MLTHANTIYTLLLVLIIVGRIPIKGVPAKETKKRGKKDRNS